MSAATKKKISKALRKYHRCAKRAKCSTKKPAKPKAKQPKQPKAKQPKKHRKKKKKKEAGSDLPAGYNIHTGKLDELFMDED